MHNTDSHPPLRADQDDRDRRCRVRLESGRVIVSLDGDDRLLLPVGVVQARDGRPGTGRPS